MNFDELKIKDSTSNSFFNIKRSEHLKIIFRNSKNEIIGVLKENDSGELSFEGKADQSAKIFFDSVIKQIKS